MTYILAEPRIPWHWLLEPEHSTESPAVANPSLTPSAGSYVTISCLSKLIWHFFFCLWKATNEFSVLKMMVGNVSGVLSTMDTGCITLKPREGCIKKSTAPYQARNSYIMLYMCGFFLERGSK